MLWVMKYLLLASAATAAEAHVSELIRPIDKKWRSGDVNKSHKVYCSLHIELIIISPFIAPSACTMGAVDCKNA